MKKIFTVVLFALAGVSALRAQSDTLRLSSSYTTHVIFPTDVTYADMSNTQLIGVKLIEQNRNMIAMKARRPFTESCSVSALESNGSMHTFIVVYDEHPKTLVVDLRGGGMPAPVSGGKGASGDNVSVWKTGSAPLLSDVIQEQQRLYHIACKEYDIRVLCEDISSYSDITYFVLSVKNDSGISYDVTDATFVVESKRKRKRSVKYDNTQFPRSRYGTLSVGPGEYSRIAYSFDKMTLSKDQVLRIYFYENGGQRNLVLTVNPSDVNRARSTR